VGQDPVERLDRGTAKQVFEANLRERAARRQAAAEVLHRAERLAAERADRPESER
jgi:hypothetical protein